MDFEVAVWNLDEFDCCSNCGNFFSFFESTRSDGQRSDTTDGERREERRGRHERRGSVYARLLTWLGSDSVLMTRITRFKRWRSIDRTNMLRMLKSFSCQRNQRCGKKGGRETTRWRHRWETCARLLKLNFRLEARCPFAHSFIQKHYKRVKRRTEIKGTKFPAQSNTPRGGESNQIKPAPMLDMEAGRIHSRWWCVLDTSSTVPPFSMFVLPQKSRLDTWLLIPRDNDVIT